MPWDQLMWSLNECWQPALWELKYYNIIIHYQEYNYYHNTLDIMHCLNLMALSGSSMVCKLLCLNMKVVTAWKFRLLDLISCPEIIIHYSVNKTIWLVYYVQSLGSVLQIEELAISDLPLLTAPFHYILCRVSVSLDTRLCHSIICYMQGSTTKLMACIYIAWVWFMTTSMLLLQKETSIDQCP